MPSSSRRLARASPAPSFTILKISWRAVRLSRRIAATSAIRGIAACGAAVTPTRESRIARASRMNWRAPAGEKVARRTTLS
eukprot:scaffold145145_cov30-Tisochrysis_lutea.AAC.3